MMTASELLRRARRKARLNQRVLAERTGISQPAIARIESGIVSPRFETLSRLLEACGYELEVMPRSGAGIDRTAMRELLALTPRERLRVAAAEANALTRLLQSRR